MKILKNTKLFLLLFLFITTKNISAGAEYNPTFVLQTDYGNFRLKEPEASVVKALLESKPVQRLNYIYQYGITEQTVLTDGIDTEGNLVEGLIFNQENINGPYTRAKHSWNVFALLRRMGRPFTEQIAGALHDLQHTAGSHLGDLLFNDSRSKKCYHDENIQNFLEEKDIDQIINFYTPCFKPEQKFNFFNCCPDNELQHALRNEDHDKSSKDRDVNADRLEYILTGARYAGLITKTEIENDIMRQIGFDKRRGIWFFKTVEAATRFGILSLDLTEINDGSAWNAIIYHYAKLALNRANSIYLISKEDILYNLTDDQMWSKLVNSRDAIILNLVYKILNFRDSYCRRQNPWELNFFQYYEHEEIEALDPTRSPTPSFKVSVTVLPKFRGINPTVKTCNDNGCYNFKRLTEINREFRSRYIQTKYTLESGWQILLDSDNPLAKEPFLHGC